MNVSPRTLITHEWLEPHGGSENVFEQLLRAIPSAKSQCLWNDAKERFGDGVAETWIARTPLRRSKASSLIFQSSCWQRVDLSDVDRVVSSTHAFSHHLASRATEVGKEGYAYVHTPARYLWVPDTDSRGKLPLARALAPVLRSIDRRKVSHAVHYASNSRFVQTRVREVWGVDSTIVYPPVAVETIQARAWKHDLTSEDHEVLAELPNEFVLGASRLVPYKRVHEAIRVAQLLDMPCVVAGTGPQLDRLKEDAAGCSVPVKFVGRVGTPLLYGLYERATLFCFLAIEDFGIMPVEAIALGTPVLASYIGGVAESVGATSGGATVSALNDQELREAALLATTADMEKAALRARAYGESAFRKNIQTWLGEQEVDEGESISIKKG